jgi:hypothetical protein
MRGNAHVRFGGRRRGNHRLKSAARPSHRRDASPGSARDPAPGRPPSLAGPLHQPGAGLPERRLMPKAGTGASPPTHLQPDGAALDAGDALPGGVRGRPCRRRSRRPRACECARKVCAQPSVASHDDYNNLTPQNRGRSTAVGSPCSRRDRRWRAWHRCSDADRSPRAARTRCRDGSAGSTRADRQPVSARTGAHAGIVAAGRDGTRRRHDRFCSWARRDHRPARLALGVSDQCPRRQPPPRSARREFCPKRALRSRPPDRTLWVPRLSPALWWRPCSRQHVSSSAA